jgi:hypothetical protein
MESRIQNRIQELIKLVFALFPNHRRLAFIVNISDNGLKVFFPFCSVNLMD